ncbi:MAG: hypothetical protein HY904_23595 [Deltaproteobacteria bacterium]|nr:hypothetical protein [Deltaproteobacteria bacterium]
MRLSVLSLAVPLWAGLSFLLQASSCTPTSGGDDGGSSSGAPQHFCTQDTDCNEFESCVGGVCQRPCGTDDVCEWTEFCNGSGYCQQGCRDTPSCDDTTKLCVDGACVDRTTVGTCGTKADCDATKVCTDGQCVNPPATCSGPQDCPGSGQCNGFTHACFDPAGDCTVAADCNGKPGCTEGCTCTQDRRCVATPTCTLTDEATVCGVNSYCDTAQNPSRCASSPTCQRQADCDAAALSCNRTTHLCLRAPTCSGETDCTAAAPFTKCNTAAGHCQEPTCTNGGITCSGTETCGTDGRCSPGGAQTCTTNTDCPATQYCDNATLTCKTGCRSDANCNAAAGEKCNNAHACVVVTGTDGGSAGGAGDGEACPNGDGDCRVGYACSPLLGVCREQCTSASCPCPQTGYGCIGGFCSPFQQPPTGCTP